MKKFFGENVRFVEDEPPEWTELDYSIQVKYDGELSWLNLCFTVREGLKF